MEGWRRRRDEFWRYRGEDVEVVGKYRYLGMTVTSGLSMSEHLRERRVMVRNSVGAVWNRVIGNESVSLSVKYRLFASVFRSMFCYAAQVWGYGYFEEVDGLLRYYLKRVLRLPSSTPNYVVALETGAPILSLDTLGVHAGYIVKVLFRYGENRMPRRLLMMELTRRCFWFKEWIALGERVNVDISGLGNCMDEDVWKSRIECLLQRVSEFVRMSYVASARKSTHGLYGYLDYGRGLDYVKDESGFSVV